MRINFKVSSEVDKEIALEKMKKVLFKSMMKMHELAVMKCPVDTGRLRESLSVTPMEEGHEEYNLTDGVKYGKDIEYGTSPHYVSPEALKGWSRRVLGDEGASYPVAKKIAQEGTNPQPYFRPALKEVKDIHVKKIFKRVFPN
ncbi:MAG: HK97 gp10 family phage protein [archaeon]